MCGMGGNLKLGNRRDIFGGDLAVYFMISRLVSFFDRSLRRLEV